MSGFRSPFHLRPSTLRKDFIRQLQFTNSSRLCILGKYHLRSVQIVLNAVLLKYMRKRQITLFRSCPLNGLLRILLTLFLQYIYHQIIKELINSGSRWH